MNRILSIFLIAASTILINKISSAQIIPEPFSNTWYGFNTMTGAQEYFISRAQVVDIDNDNDSDVIASKYFAGFMGSATGFVVLKNDGSGFYGSTPVNYSSPATSEYIECADFNNDGFPDVAVSNTGRFGNGSSVSIFFNTGNGTFVNSAEYTTGTGPIGITSNDFNNDGKLDIAVANYGMASGSTISVLINTGNGVFNQSVSYPAGDGPYAIASAKINNDNFIDIVTARDNGTVNVLLNNGQGEFPDRTEIIVSLTSSSYFPCVYLTDIDNDSDNDILYSNTALGNSGATAVGMLRNTGNGFSPVEFLNMTFNSSGITDIETTDLNNDGWKDLICTSTSARAGDGYNIKLSNGNGGFQAATLYSAGQNTADVMVADINNDSKIDVLTADSYSMMITVHKNTGGGIFSIPMTFDVGNSITGSVDASDFDNDGDLDILLSGSGRAATGVTVKVMKNLGAGNFSPGITYSIRGGGVQAKFRDLNGDNKPDILFATAINSPPYDFHYAINNGDGTFGNIQTKSIGACGWYDIDAADLDNDGDNDVIITEWLGCMGIPESSRRIYVCLNSGNAVFGNPIIKIVNPQPAPIATGDFNHDGKIDVVTSSAGANIEVCLGTGNGNLQDPVSYFIGDQGGVQDIVVEDFNNDNYADIASSNFWETTSMTLFYGNADGTFQQPEIFPSAYSPDLLNVSGIAAGDLDNDGDKDIVVANNASNSFSLYYNNNGVFSYQFRAGGWLSVSSPVFGDFDSDNRLDLGSAGALPPSGIPSTFVLIKGANTGMTAVQENFSEIPESFFLYQNYPNPFNPSTNLDFEVSNKGFISLKVFDILGKEITSLVNENKLQGKYSVRFDGSNLPSGIYYYSLLFDGKLIQTKKMSLVK